MPAQNDFHGQNLSGRSFKNQDLSGADFSNCDLRGVNFSGANLTGAKFCNARMGITLTIMFIKLIINFVILGIIIAYLSIITNGMIYLVINKYMIAINEINFSTVNKLSIVIGNNKKALLFMVYIVFYIAITVIIINKKNNIIEKYINFISNITILVTILAFILQLFKLFYTKQELLIEYIILPITIIIIFSVSTYVTTGFSIKDSY